MTFLCNQGHSLNFLFSDSSSFRTVFDVSLVSKTSASTLVDHVARQIKMTPQQI